jgi:hypothetical protein
MKIDRVSPSGHHRVHLRDSDLILMVCVIAEALEERGQSFNGLQLRQLTRLHRRLAACVGAAEPDYAMRADGAVVSARDRACIIVPAPGLVDMLRQMGGAHG